MNEDNFFFARAGNILPQPPEERKYLKEATRQKEDIDTTNNNRLLQSQSCQGQKGPVKAHLIQTPSLGRHNS